MKEIRERVKSALRRIRPSLQADGGDAELVGISPDGVVTVRLTGLCRGCPMSELTLKMGIERSIRKEVPEVKRVVAV